MTRCAEATGRHWKREDRCVPATLSIATATDVAPGAPSLGFLAPALVGKPFTQIFTALGGTGSYSFRSSTAHGLDGQHFVHAGNVDTLTGKPTAASSFMTLTVQDSAGDTFSGTYTLNVAPSAFTLTPDNVTPQATLGGSSINVSLVTMRGDSGAYHIITPGFSTAPDGLALQANGSTVYLTGTPTAAGQFPSFVEIGDSYGNVAIQDFTLIVPSASIPVTVFWTLNNSRALPVATVGRTKVGIVTAYIKALGIANNVAAPLFTRLYAHGHGG
jgi:hypothetical protein